MPPKPRSRADAAAYHKFKDFHCDSADFDFNVSVDKFDLERFSRPFEPRFKKPLKPGIAIEAMLSTRNPNSADYHVHLNWRLARKHVRIRLGFYPGAAPADREEVSPFAENSIPWLGDFFKAAEAPAHLHVAFEYPSKRWIPMLPLPLKVPIQVGGAGEVEIDGMSFSLGKNESGIPQAWVTKRDEITRVLLYGDRTISFAAFDIISELRVFSSIARMLVKELPDATV